MSFRGASLRLLEVLLTDPSGRWYGYQMMKAAKLKSGSLYPMLARLEEEGLLESEWEPPKEGGASGRPQRKYYRLTGEGVRVARIEIAQASMEDSRRVPGTTRPARGGA